MKANKCVYVFICLLVVAPILFAEDYKKEIPVEDAMKAFCVTWINDNDELYKKHTYYNNDHPEDAHVGEGDRLVPHNDAHAKNKHL